MKKTKIFACLIAFLTIICAFSSCGAALDDELYDETVGKKMETTPPGDVKELKAVVFDKAVTLQWENPTDKDFYGLTISANPAAGSLEKPMTFINDDMGKIPTIINVNNLPGNVSYTFTVKTFDYNMNYSSGASVTAKPDGDNATSSGNFFGTGEVFAYKKDKSAFDFGYCEPGSTSTKVIEIFATDAIDTTSTSITSTGKIGQGKFELIDVEPKKTVNIGEKISITVKYTPSSTPCWDEMDLLIGGASNSKLTLLGSSFKQPKDVRLVDSETNQDYGVKLWLRADMIGKTDVNDSGLVKRIPDYSGRGYHAYCTDTDYRYAPTYVLDDVDFNRLPGIDFDTNNNTYRSQFLSMGTGSDPIINSSKGSTTFVVLRTPTDSTSAQTIIAANYGQSYPTLVNTTRYYNYDGWGNCNYGWSVRGSGLYGTYRYPCVSNSTTDPDNKWFTNDLSSTTSICMRYDQELKSISTDRADGRKDYPSNIRMQINGEERLLSFIYSNNTTTETQPLGTSYAQKSTSSANCYGAYGKPISDGKGHRYGTLSEVKTPTSTEIAKINGINGNSNPSNAAKHIYYHWYSDVRDNSTFSDNEHYSIIEGTRNNPLGRTYPNDRKWDYAYTHTPYEYLNEDAQIARSYSKSYASSDDGCPAAAYYTNWISNESRRNGTIYSIIIGADNNIATISRGKIAEVIMFDYALSDAEIDVVNNYIYYRYGIGTAK